VGDALLRVRASEALARAELARGRLRAADESARRAIDLAQRTGWEAGLYRLHALTGRIQEKKGDVAGAASAFAESARGIARLREGLKADMRSSFDGLSAVRDVEMKHTDADATAALLRELVAHLRKNRTQLREEWARRITESKLLTAMTREEIFAEATSVYDNYVEVLETGSVEALQAYARNLS